MELSGSIPARFHSCMCGLSVYAGSCLATHDFQIVSVS